MGRLGTIILHGGYDSFKEELYSTMRYLASDGYDVINFDVPWMSGSPTAADGGFDYRWEKIIGAILDHYDIEDVALIGVSYGGWLAITAAAFEPRVTRVVASSVSIDVNQYEGRLAQFIAGFARRRMRTFANNQILKEMASDAQTAWFFDHLMHVTGRTTPLEAADVLAEINVGNFAASLPYE